jgi:hypothetical protein
MLNTKRISKSRIEEGDIKAVLDTLAIVNSMSEFETTLNGRLLSDYKIPLCFKPFLLPSKVTIESGTKFPDLRELRDVSKLKPMTITELEAFCDKLASTFKMDSMPTFCLADREVKTLHECNEAVILFGDDLLVRSEDDSLFVPVPLKSFVGMCFGTHVFNEDAEFVLGEFINRFSFVSK